MSVERFPKLESPFIRNGTPYTVNNDTREEYSWYKEGEAVEKLDGTNTAVEIRNGDVKAAYTRITSGRDMSEGPLQ